MHSTFDHQAFKSFSIVFYSPRSVWQTCPPRSRWSPDTARRSRSRWVRPRSRHPGSRSSLSQGSWSVREVLKWRERKLVLTDLLKLFCRGYSVNTLTKHFTNLKPPTIRRSTFLNLLIYELGGYRIANCWLGLPDRIFYNFRAPTSIERQVFYVAQKRWAMDFQAPKTVKCLVGYGTERSWTSETGFLKHRE